MLYRIVVAGCDESTTIRKELTEEQAQFLGGVANEITKESSYSCEPRMNVTLIVPGDYDHPDTVKQEDLPYSQTDAAKHATEQLREGFAF